MNAHVILSFDVEEHHQIEAAAGLAIPSNLRAHYKKRVDVTTRWLLDLLAQHNLHATFFVVGQIARSNPGLIRDIQRAGHEIASHSWEHQRMLNLTPDRFRADLLRSKDMLEDITGKAVVGFRAPTFSVVRSTAWALDILAECGFVYDSSIFPVHHDRYGLPDAPRTPFMAQGEYVSMLELPIATLRVPGGNIPAGGGGYFRLFPLFILKTALRQLTRSCHPPVAVLYFHPWEFDEEMIRLPLRGLSSFRTYVGIRRSRGRLEELLTKYQFGRACDVAGELSLDELPSYRVSQIPAVVPVMD